MRSYFLLIVTLVAVVGCKDEGICFTGLGIAVHPHDTTVTVGHAYQLTVVYSGCSGSQTQAATNFTWSSPDPGIAVVDSLGRVTGLMPGEVTLAVASRGIAGLLMHPTVAVRP